MTADGTITTLGRGGSDTTAVAVAAGIGADVCEIYTDVDGVYTADPRIVPDARKIDVVSYEEMLEMAASGAGVLQMRSVEFARNHGVIIHCRSSFHDGPGTIVKEADESMEQAIISGVTHDTSEAKVTLRDVPDHPGVAARVFTELAQANVNVDMIIQNVSEAGTTDISFTVPKDDLVRAKRAVSDVCAELGAREWSVDESIAKISLVGAGMKTHPGISAKMFSTLADAGVNIDLISTSPIRISCVISAEQVGPRGARAARRVRARQRRGHRRGIPGGYWRRCLMAWDKPMPARPVVAVAGVTGAVGREMLLTLRAAQTSPPSASSRLRVRARPARRSRSRAAS